METETTKYCGGCQRDLPLSGFGEDLSAKDGLARQCRGCKRQQRKEYRATEHGREVIHQANRKSLATEKGREGHRRRDKKYYEKNREKCLQRSRKRQPTPESRKVRRLSVKNYRATLRGHLGHIFGGMNQRCNNPNCRSFKNYGARGIENKFGSSEDFINHVTNELGITDIDQIKGLYIHRIDNNKHYEIGNIKFLIPTEHTAVHTGPQKPKKAGQYNE
ncbi:hypothetical protein LCGC14_0536080 [marine sediment metagenome]|uniref:Nuclease associated modular domain-containing protein n=1 Tax=marine sediment metagenome TaxID=412755 RepID=A0A0F9UFL3_9ZZZZ